MKKTYISPSMTVTAIQSATTILAGSGGVGNGDAVGNAYNDGDVSYSRDGFFDDEEDWEDE